MILKDDIIVYGSANMQDTDAGTTGGAIDRSKKPIPIDLDANANLQIVSSATTDTTQTVAITGLDPSGVLVSETKTLNGRTAVPMTVTTVWERWLKAIKNLTTAGDIAVEKAGAALTSGTMQAGSAAKTATKMAFAKLAVGASGVDNAYQFMVLRITGGTGVGQIRWIVEYNGTSKEAAVNRDWDVLPDNTSTYDIRYGFVFQKTPQEIMECRRPFYNAVADAPGGSAKNYYEKFFVYNEHGSLTLTSGTVAENSDPSGKIDFMLEGSLDGSVSVANRNTAPAGTFDSNQKNIANSQNLTFGHGQPLWIHLLLNAGDTPAKTTYVVDVSGVTA